MTALTSERSSSALEGFPKDVVLASRGPISVRGIKFHETHCLAHWDLHGFYFCLRCGRAATVDGRQLSGVCQLRSRKGGENP